ncbi:MAG: hypothetical protein II921_03275 [Treponema sp.]|nr:hypothetical protein [Treponema sp.]
MKDSALEKRIKKIAGRPLKTFKTLPAYLVLLFYPFLNFTSIKTLLIIANEFFFLQFFEKFGIFKIPVVHVDHPLDDKIPFTPSKVGIYLDFVKFWMRPLNMLMKRFGIVKSAPLMKKWMLLFRGLYIYSSQVYKYKLSTTNRPIYKENRHFKTIHTFDPHYLCVPSLHIATVALAYGFYRKLFRDEQFTEVEIAQWEKEIYDGAIEISETVLYIKQHSVNCIPAALYMVSENFSEYFSIDDAIAFVNDMFKTVDPDIAVSTDDIDKIRNHIHFVYERFLLEGRACINWYDPVRRFLDNYENEPKENADKF